MTVTSLTVTLVAVGAEYQATAVAGFSDGSTVEVTTEAAWSTSDSTIATVSETGRVTTVSGGTVNVIATYQGVTGQTALTIDAAPDSTPPPTVTSLAVSASATTMTVGGTTTVTGTATHSDGTTGAVTPTWSSSNTAVATVSSSGAVTAVAAGTTTITGTFAGQASSVGITVVAADATVSSLAVGAAATTVSVGATVTVTATATYSDGTSGTVNPNRVVWLSSDESLATVTDEGTVMGVAAGTTTITGTFGGESGTVVLTVVAADVTVTEIVVTASATTVSVGATVTVTATATYSDGTSGTVNPNRVVWLSSDESLATVTDEGTVMGVAAGTTTITGTFGGESGTVVLTVVAADVTVTEIVVTASATTVSVGATVTVTATATYSDGTSGTVNPNRVVWLSSDESLATVTDEGTVMGVAAGTTTITGTFGGESGTVVLTVVAADVTVTEIVVTTFATTVLVGATVTVTATASYSDGTSATISPTWVSSDTSVATVTMSGTVTAVAAGTTTISGTADGQSGSIVLTVTAPTSTWRGIVVADENRCSPYDSGDYSYPQSVEDAIIDRLGGIYSPTPVNALPVSPRRTLSTWWRGRKPTIAVSAQLTGAPGAVSAKTSII